MCGRYYVDDDTAREIEKVVREVDEKLRRERRGDIYPSQSATVITGRKPHLLAEEMSWGFPQYQKKRAADQCKSRNSSGKKVVSG